MSLFRRIRTESEMENELDRHIHNRADALERSGLSSAEAMRRARVEFGGYQRFKDECREAMGSRFFHALIQDVSFGFRMLRKSPGFAVVAALTLALGIGANTAVFSVVYAALLRPLPYTQPDRLIAMGEVRDQKESSIQSAAPYLDVSYPDYLDWKGQTKAFQSLAGFGGDTFMLHGAGETQLVFGAEVTPNFFSTLGVKPFLGRDFAAGDDISSGPAVVILGYGLWAREYAADPHIVGRSIQLGAKSVRVVGVLPREFEFAPQGTAEMWAPMHLGKNMETRRNLRWMTVIGRLASGVAPEQALAEMKLTNANLAAAYPQANGSIQVVMVPLRDMIVGKVQPLLLILFGAAGFVLLIACANIANLLMARAAARRREFAIRTALGASRWRLISQSLAESLILAAAGGALGFFPAQWGTSLLIAVIPRGLLASMPFLRDAHANPVILAFLCAAALLTGIVFGLAPALQVAHTRVGSTLKEEARVSASGARARARNALVVIEIAFSLVLLTGAGLMLQSLTAILHRNPGFDTHNLLTFAVNLPTASYPKDPDAIQFDQQFTARVRNLPGVEGVASNSIVPLAGGGGTIRFVMEGQPTAAGHENECDIRDVSSEYFSVMKIPLASGRVFNDSADSPTAPNHVIVNRVWAERYFHDSSPIGKRLRFTFSPKEPYREIVGVVANTADASLDSPDRPAIFLPFQQDAGTFINYVVRTAGDPAAAIGTMRAALRDADPHLVMIQPLTMDRIIAQSPSVFLRRYPSYLIGSFAALALILAMIGLYGLISYSVSQRANELGIRIALGAQRRDIMRLVLAEGSRLTLIGVAAGIVAALALTRLMRSLLYGVSAFDPFTFGAVVAILAVVALVACCIPARRAMRTDPVIALRYE